MLTKAGKCPGILDWWCSCAVAVVVTLTWFQYQFAGVWLQVQGKISKYTTCAGCNDLWSNNQFLYAQYEKYYQCDCGHREYGMYPERLRQRHNCCAGIFEPIPSTDCRADRQCGQNNCKTVDRVISVYKDHKDKGQSCIWYLRRQRNVDGLYDETTSMSRLSNAFRSSQADGSIAAISSMLVAVLMCLKLSSLYVYFVPLLVRYYI